jgi:LuxR family transcriptional regulator, maltose regulon positive regulatory protein
MFILELTGQGPSAMQLIIEKILVPSPTTHVSRPRLLDLLHESLKSCSSTIINGRAGSGKTTLSADFARDCIRPTAWYKVDAPDGDILVFFNYLIASLQRHRPTFGRQNLEPLLASSSDEIPLLADAFSYELVETDCEPLLIVIEDLHMIYDAPWVVPFFSRLLPFLPAGVHMLITSRTMPPAPLWRMRSKQSLAVIEEAELAFTRQEAIELFETRGLSREQASIALDHTHGRAGALNFCADSLVDERSRLLSGLAVLSSEGD